ncbi:BQ5605_C008g05124 [Microbotryum silenes-dioicae]|uniref:BQ5605_C008g05124 protein n=1 Tax=Microbotryum silenes-dioicae TaxID=796604 RepID=A0A2X0P7T7_9BASI|nr:BQ5605_C008g05124 [Microbotryum silenes-dioicae]
MVHQSLISDFVSQYTYSKDIGKLFKRKGVEGKATFFINGYNYGCIYNKENVNALRARHHEGFEFGLSSLCMLCHADLVNLSSVQIVKQVELLETAVERILGVRLGMFIAPYDSIDEKAAKVIRDKGYKIVRWSLDSGDTTFYLGRPQSSVNLIRKWIKKASGKSGIGLFDETKADTVYKVLPHSIDLLKKSGYKLVTLSECLGVEPYQKGHFHRSEPDKTWTCGEFLDRLKRSGSPS